MKRILALDLGTKTGYAVNKAGQTIIASTWILGSPKAVTSWGKLRLTRRCDPRVVLLYKTLRAMAVNHEVDQVVFEDVTFSTTTYQTQLWSALRAAVWCAFSNDSSVLIECVPVGTLKKFATNHGGATKEMMASALYRLSPGLRSANLDDNAIDAIWLWRWAEQNLAQATA